MNEPASDVISARARAEATLTPMVAWSVAAHVVIVAAIWLAPARPSSEPSVVMRVNLDVGAPGPRSGGLTQMGGRAVPERPPEPPKPVPQPPRPAPPREAAALPSPSAPARPARRESTPAAPSPSAPEQPRDGSTRVETGARGQGFGFATGGSGQQGIQVEAQNFCCPAYLELVRAAIERAWERTPGVVAVTTMRFRILRNGAIDSVSIVQSSGNPTLDAAAARAISRVPPNTLPLPAEFPDSSLALRMRFENR